MIEEPKHTSGRHEDDVQPIGYRRGAMRIQDRAPQPLHAELAIWEKASDEDLQAFENRLIVGF